MMFDVEFSRIINRMDEDVSPFEIENYPKGLVFLLPMEDRPADFPPLPDNMAEHRFWHTGIIYNGQIYETFNHSKSSIKSAIDRLSDPAFKNVVYASTPINTSKLIAEIDSGTDCATYVGRVLGLSDTKGYEKDPKIWPDTIFEHLKSQGGRIQTGVKELKSRRQTIK